MPGRQRILSDAQIEQMVEMRERGLSTRTIAAWFTKNGTPISEKTVNWHCLKEGAFTYRCRRGGNHFGRGRPFTTEEDATILAMRIEGKGVSEIGRAIDRPHNSIIARLLTLAKYEETGGG